MRLLRNRYYEIEREVPDRRIRFTIMHEIGHIIFDHTEHSVLAQIRDR